MRGLGTCAMLGVLVACSAGTSVEEDQLAGVAPAAVEALSAPRDRLRIVSWNIANLAEGPSEMLRGGYARSQSDYDALRHILADLNPDIVALQEIGSRAGVERILDAAQYEIAFESRCLENAAECAHDTGDIYTAVAYKKDLPEAVAFQMDTLAIDHTNECGVTRKVRGGVGVSFLFGEATVKVPSLHMKASCKDDQVEPGTQDDCDTQARQYSALLDWVAAQPDDDIIVLAGDFNRKLLDGGDSIRKAMDTSQGALGDSLFPDAGARACWSRSDFTYDFGRLKDEAKANNPDIVAQGVDPFIYTPDANQEIDFFILRGQFDGHAVSSDQVEPTGQYRFENPGSTITACDGKSIVKFEGQDRALVFGEAYPSDHCPIVMTVGPDPLE